jgi:hypothetical protein
MTGSQGWGLARRIGFRLGIVFGVLLLYPFPIDALPKADLVSEPLRQPLVWATAWFARAVLGIPGLADVSNGSGDRTFDYVRLLLFAILGAIGALAWSARSELGRGGPRSYPRLAAAAHVMLRYYVAYAMLAYGLAKIFRLQFPPLSPIGLQVTRGDSSPMGLLWGFMGYSGPYTVFGGLCEAIPGLLLMWRRTATIGAVVVMAVMTNIVMLNFSYDVPVKLYSMQLLVMAGLIVLPDARRLLAAALGRATAEVPPRARRTPWRERVRLVSKAAFLVAMAVGLYLNLASSPFLDPIHEFYGNWVVDTFVADGVERPPLATDPVRWNSLSANVTIATIWLTSGGHEPGPDRDHYRWKVDEANHTITVTVDDDGKVKEVWHYSHPAPDRLVIDGVHLGKSLHVTLHVAPPTRLLTRGFHWINEAPFNR